MRLIDADKLKQDDEITLWLSRDTVRAGKMLKAFSELFVRKIDEQPTIEVTPHESVTKFADRCRECGARHKKESENGMKLEEFTDKIVTTVKEDSDRFIFETVGEWLSIERKIIIPKKVLLRSIECFKQEHKEEFDALMEVYGKED